MKNFILKTLVVTISIAILIGFFCPKYYFPKEGYRCNVFTGECETLNPYDGWVRAR